MRTESLSIVNFKNIRQAELTFSPNVNALIGQNGMGKTNLLDALYMLSFCKSATQPQDTLCITHGEPFMMVQGRYTLDDGTEETIHIGIKAGQKKTMRRGGKAYKRLSEHIGLLPLVMVSPSDTILILGGSEERRRLMDQVISQYDHEYLDCLVSYNKALQQRNAMLKMEGEADDSLMELWEEEMARNGETIYERRKAFVERFVPLFQSYYREISQEKETVELRYTSHGERGPLLATIANGRSKDRIMGFSLHGVHRDDLEMGIGGHPLRREGSQGQCKTFLVAMKLAQFEFIRQAAGGTTPMLLLDDIFDKLDASRVEQIVRLVASERFGQIFITDTNRDHLDSILGRLESQYKLFGVEDGTITDMTC